ncbi:MAG: glutamate--tRNA ligase family protein, partial [Chthoniobacterales bacterium]
MLPSAQALPHYRGRIAPSPTGYLHAGHAATFWQAQTRAREHGGQLVLRIEDLDRGRCRPEFERAIIDDLRWFGLSWDEGLYRQNERRHLYLAAWEKLRDAGVLYACSCSRRDLLEAAAAPHAENEESL